MRPTGSGLAEVTDLATLRRRGGPEEFVGIQRLGFEMIVRVTDGGAFHDVDFTTYHLVPDDLLWVHAGQVQRWGRIVDLEGDVVLFTPDAVAHIGPGRQADVETPNYWPGAAAEGSVLATAFTAVRAWLARPLGSDMASTADIHGHLIAALLTQVHAADLRASALPPADPAMSALTRLVESDYAREHGVEHYARALGYSPRTLNRITHRHAGLTVKAFIDRRIILEARRLLAHGDWSVSRIAAALGFDDPTNFSAYFRHRTGTSPGSFRASTRPS